MDILQQIMGERRAAVDVARREVSVEALRERAAGRVHHSLEEALGREGTSIVAEVKKASPSAGLLRPDYDPGAMAGIYEANGACGISVLTEPKHFLGSADHLAAVRAAVSLPVLRKDFMCDPYQVLEAAAWGADVVLLIVAALEDGLMRDLYDTARELGLDVLAESHNEEELERALRLEDAILGVNSRNLKTLKTDLATAHALSGRVPPDRLSLAESGIKTRHDIEGLTGAGYSGFLIGESIVGHDDPGAKLRELRGEHS
ncbi:MAG: indole-3-glycerol phosphate synthase TrpC [Kiritimatiellia bacterium]|jgi:indole-3-glycerol phosphate synthase|nr:indole-3-glycerol phosphate synthase TrpC [Kiritimatiellia bacterium]MDP6630766.1 indole-3-glycerol phosphate synthase TrpC [Kiritimatiellia bacterium]MDP6809370.1 indole-3-glycerol phosphate synthase TrpC [Kiritimatiellia bacterium]MDP7023952.1 indole-3-glycerol phosphate synthase TrpC [Kiritimatiellia bacterium]